MTINEDGEKEMSKEGIACGMEWSPGFSSCTFPTFFWFPCYLTLLWCFLLLFFTSPTVSLSLFSIILFLSLCVSLSLLFFFILYLSLCLSLCLSSTLSLSLILSRSFSLPLYVSPLFLPVSLEWCPLFSCFLSLCLSNLLLPITYFLSPTLSF